jgi:methionyl-tRNA formyltransferase
MVDSVEVPIALRETAGTLHDTLAGIGAQAIVSTLHRLAHERVLTATPQPVSGVSYASKIGRAEAALDWTRPAAALDRWIRALDPAPGAFTRLGTLELKVWSAVPVDPPSPRTTGPAPPPAAAPGTVLAVRGEGIDVACGEGALRLLGVQPAAGKRMSAPAFAAGRALSAGSRFGAAPEA